METIIKILEFILHSFIHIWPYLLITIPLAVGIQFSSLSKYIGSIFSKRPWISIVLATLIGAISPFCSCGVIPVIASLLISGVPLAPVMSFWIASPSMDPEIFFLSTATIGWNLSVWRLIATFSISLTSGFITLWAVKKGYLGDGFLKNDGSPLRLMKPSNLPQLSISKLRILFRRILAPHVKQVQMIAIQRSNQGQSYTNCCVTTTDLASQSCTQEPAAACSCSDTSSKVSFYTKLFRETWKACSLVFKFMFIAFLMSALIEFYLPKNLLTSLLGGSSPFSVFIATLAGIPFYTSNITALPLVSGLLTLGMSKGAALAFLISGPLTTLPAMMAVWGIVKPKVFALYLLFALLGALFFGYLFEMVQV